MDKTNGLGKEYLEHKTFKQFTEFASFYDSLSYTAMGFVSQGTKSIVNLGTYVFTSIKDTIEY